MLKTVIVAAFTLFSFVTYSAQLTYIGQLPNTNLGFVSSLMENYVILYHNIKARPATEIFSILDQEKLTSVSVIQADFHQRTTEEREEILELAASRSSVVLAHITPRDGYECLAMKREPDTLFIMPAGDVAVDLNIPGNGIKWCDAPNLLFVGPLAQSGVYMPSANYGTQYIRVATVGQNVRVINDDGYRRVMTGSMAAAAKVAARVALFSQKFPRLKGLYLAHRYLEMKTKSHRNIMNKVRNGKIALDR